MGRLHQFWPGVPTDISKGRWMMQGLGPSQMIACEQKLVVVEQNRVALGMSWDRNNQQIRSQLYWFRPFELNFYILRPTINFILVQNAIATKVVMKLAVIGHIVSVG